MERKYQVIHSPQAQEFKDTLGRKEQKKIDFVIDKVEMGFFGDWFKKMSGSDDIWEFTVDFNGVFHRLLAFFDTTDKEDPLIITTHGFKKKTNKTPKNELEKAQALKKKYFRDIAE